MPLILLGLIVVIGIVIYALVIYARSDDDDDRRPLRERYSRAFHQERSSDSSGGFDYDFGEDEEDEPARSGDGNTMFFPTDAEVEKRKRNIH